MRRFAGVNSSTLNLGRRARSLYECGNRLLDFFAMAEQEFHFLVRVKGSSTNFHFQTLAMSRVAALRKARCIPNLVELREISAEELKELLRDVKHEGP
jgi:hypothetical protein